MFSCQGLMGNIFGHSFESFMIKHSPPANVKGLEVPAHYMAEVLESLGTTEYQIYCKRCGAKPEPKE